VQNFMLYLSTPQKLKRRGVTDLRYYPAGSFVHFFTFELRQTNRLQKNKSREEQIVFVFLQDKYLISLLKSDINDQRFSENW
jgi:hypothetical protein